MSGAAGGWRGTDELDRVGCSCNLVLGNWFNRAPVITSQDSAGFQYGSLFSWLWMAWLGLKCAIWPRPVCLGVGTGCRVGQLGSPPCGLLFSSRLVPTSQHTGFSLPRKQEQNLQNILRTRLCNCQDVSYLTFYWPKNLPYLLLAKETYWNSADSRRVQKWALPSDGKSSNNTF